MVASAAGGVDVRKRARWRGNKGVGGGEGGGVERLKQGTKRYAVHCVCMRVAYCVCMCVAHLSCTLLIAMHVYGRLHPRLYPPSDTSRAHVSIPNTWHRHPTHRRTNVSCFLDDEAEGSDDGDHDDEEGCTQQGGEDGEDGFESSFVNDASQSEPPSTTARYSVCVCVPYAAAVL